MRLQSLTAQHSHITLLLSSLDFAIAQYRLLLASVTRDLDTVRQDHSDDYFVEVGLAQDQAAVSAFFTRLERLGFSGDDSSLSDCLERALNVHAAINGFLGTNESREQEAADELEEREGS